MPIYSEGILDERFQSLDEVRKWSTGQSLRLVRIPILGLLENHAVFADDEFFGIGDTLFRFNESGIRKFCSVLGFHFDQLEKLSTPKLASDVINDLLSQADVRERVSKSEFVVDQSSNVVMGVVTNSYVTYENSEFISSIENHLLARQGGLFAEDEFEFVEGYAVNTELTLRFCSNKYHGTISGRGGNDVDRTLIGLQFCNSMEGTSSVKADYFLHRLVCANGMMVPAASSINRINHSGKRDTFDDRLETRLQELLRTVGRVEDMISFLGDVRFDPKLLVSDANISKLLFDVVPGIKNEISKRYGIELQNPRTVDATERRKQKIERDSNIVSKIPDYLGGEHTSLIFKSSFRDSATVFDLINVFTEHAKTKERSVERLEIERKAGELAKYINDNKRRL